MSKIRWAIESMDGPSTEARLRRLGEAGSPAGTVVSSTLVDRGDGRRPLKGAMNASVLLDPSTTERLSFMPLVVAFSAAEGIRKDTGIVTRLKWPNEVLIGEKTVGRTSWSAFRCGSRTRLAVTMTVNCNFHSSLMGEPRSTTILDELGVKIDIAMLLSKTLESLNWMYSEWERGMEGNLVTRISPTIETLGRRVEAKLPGEAPLTCLARRIDDEGSLVVEDDGGSERALAIEWVEWLRNL